MFNKPKRRLPKLERPKGLCGKPLNIQHGNGAAVVVRAGESSAHGEGRQEVTQYKLMERCVRHREKSTKRIGKSEIQSVQQRIFLPKTLSQPV